MNRGARVKPSPFFYLGGTLSKPEGFADEIEQDRSKQGRLSRMGFLGDT
jgi:hypothetical protein